MIEPAMHTNSCRRNRILIAASLLIPLFLYCITIWKDYRAILQANRDEAIRTVHIFEQHAENVLETHQLLAERVNDRLKGMDWPAIGRSGEIHAYLAKIQEQYPQVDAIWLADRAGIIRNASRPLPPVPVSIADRDYFKALRNSGEEMFIGQIVLSRVLKKQVLNITYRRGGASNTFDGVVIITVSPEYFSRFWDSVASKPDSIAVLLRRDGAILARSPHLDPALSRLPPGSTPMLAIHDAARQGSYIGVSAYDGVRRNYAFRKLPKYGLYIFYGISMQAIMQEWRSHALIYGGLFALATLALALLARSNASLLAHMEQRIAGRTEELTRVNKELAMEITVRAQAEQKLLEAKKLEAIGHIAGGVAHEVRNPLNAILFVTEALFKEPVIVGNLSLEPYVQHIRTQVRRLSHLMSDLLELEKPIPPACLRRVPIGAVCNEAISALEFSEAAKHRRLIFLADSGSDDLQVTADRVKLQQSLINLLENALQHSPPQSEVCLRLTVAEASGPSGNPAVLRITDASRGIPEDQLPRIFEPFFSNRTGGTGLGLALVKHYVESMGGTVLIWNNDPPPGCTAEVRLPLADKEPI